MSGDPNLLLLDLAEKQDKFEQEYNSALVTRVGLFLVFAGFISAVTFNFLKLAVDPTTEPKPGWLVVLFLLAVSTTTLFAAMLILLRAALLKGYSAPANVSQYREKYKELLKYHDGNIESAEADLRDWILDATAEAVDRNSSRNARRAKYLTSASGFLFLSIVSLFLALAIFLVPHFQTPNHSGTLPSRDVVLKKVSPEVSNGKEKKEEEKERKKETRSQAEEKADSPAK